LLTYKDKEKAKEEKHLLLKIMRAKKEEQIKRSK